MSQAWNRVSRLFGVGHYDETDSHAIKHQAAWLERRKRLLNRRCGRLRDEHPITCDATGLSGGPQHRANILSKRQKRSHRNRSMKSGPRSDESTVESVGGIDDSGSSKKAHDGIHSPLTASFAAATAHVPITRTTSDTAIHLTTATPHYPKDLNQDDIPYSSYYDLTDFDAKESIAKLVNDVLARHQPKRAFGMGLVGNLLSRKFRKDLTNAQLNAIYSFNDHRPYFTYWVTTVQILIMIITLFTYGFGPFGLDKTLVRDTVYVSSLTWYHEAYYEKDNIWLGPRSADLIHLGAKFTPCMRRDSLIYNEIDQDHEAERFTGCCIRNDQSGCLQTTKEDCSPLSKWHSWNESSSSAPATSHGIRRKSGPVCGQDPQYCSWPASTHPHEWPDDITRWPICQERQHSTKALHHMSCEVVGRPCCVGIYGQCRLTTSQHCQFLRGTFHPEATLCSQVSCMEDVCGMVPFYARDYPDQFYRLITALFLHAGLIHLSFTIIIQYYIMRDIERLLGSTRMAIIYLLPGVAGYMASATFVPYHTQVGPSGSQFALLACLMAETINSWKYLENPASSLGKLISIAIGLFILGLLPWIDNYAHISGFFVGLMLSLALTPYLTPFNDAYSRRKKVIQIWVCILLVILTFVLLPLPLYIFPLYKCSWCQYLDCWPLAPNWCENQDIKLTRLDIF